MNLEAIKNITVIASAIVLSVCAVVFVIKNRYETLDEAMIRDRLTNDVYRLHCDDRRYGNYDRCKWLLITKKAKAKTKSRLDGMSRQELNDEWDKLRIRME